MQAGDRPEEPDDGMPRREPRQRHRSLAGRRGSGPLGRLGQVPTRRAVVLALVVCALALSVAVPLRNYLSQRGELAEVEQQQQRLREQVEELDRRKAELSDPAQVEAEARRRLRYVRPGETPYVVPLPGGQESPGQESPAPAPEEQPQPWTSDRLREYPLIPETGR
jgi:cell division protein FtsB